MCAWQIETGQPGWMRYGKTQNVTASIPPRFTFKGVISEHPRVRPEAAKALTRFVRAFVCPESALTWGKLFSEQNHPALWLMAVSLTLSAGGTTINMMI